MRLTDILTSDRIVVDRDALRAPDKGSMLRLLGELLSPALRCAPGEIERLLAERERLQSTGIGDGVAIPHTSVEAAAGRAAALVVSPPGIPFESIDGSAVRIVLGVVGPKDATGDHLRVLARVSRVLRDPATREALAAAQDPAAACRVLVLREEQLG